MDGIPQNVAGHLLNLALMGMPNEICGFLMEDWSHIPILNTHPRPKSNFTMDEDELRAVLSREAHLVLGTYHSHPGGRTEPSDHDISIMKNYAEFRFFILTYTNVYEWRLVGGQPRSVHRDGSTGVTDLAQPLFAAAAALRHPDPQAPKRGDAGHLHRVRAAGE